MSILLWHPGVARLCADEHLLHTKRSEVFFTMPAQDLTLYDMLQSNARTFADRLAIIHSSGILTFGEFLARVEALAAGLAELSIAKGERLCILAQNDPAYWSYSSPAPSWVSSPIPSTGVSPLKKLVVLWNVPNPA
jgi:long-subunit acyl-CoA synthetase (AMP-forming)